MCCYNDFPKNTLHLVVVDPGVGSARRPIMVMTDDYKFIGPDNGVFSYIYQRAHVNRVVHFTMEHYFRQPVSNTFHGRDVFAPCAAYVSKLVDWKMMGEEDQRSCRFNKQYVTVFMSCTSFSFRYCSVADFVSAKQIIELNNRLMNASDSLHEGPTATVREQVRQMSSQARITEKLAGTDVKLQDQEYAQLGKVMEGSDSLRRSSRPARRSAPPRGCAGPRQPDGRVSGRRRQRRADRAAADLSR